MPRETNDLNSESLIWVMQDRKNHKREGRLVAYWEVEYDSISDDWKPEEISSADLFSQWIEKVNKIHPNRLIPIYWYVCSEDRKISEFMPFRYEHDGSEASHNFLTHFTWPINKQTEEKLNWLSLPVVNKLWNKRHSDKGGFIQETTGWKPGILQPYVYLPSLLQG